MEDKEDLSEVVKNRVDTETTNLIKSKERVQNHGEVFTPKFIVDKMLSQPEIDAKLKQIHATFLEPSAGEGAFLTEILRRKLEYVHQSSSSRGVHWRYNALWALASIYGIEFLEDNLKIAHERMAHVFMESYQKRRHIALSMDSDPDMYRSMQTIIKLNIVQGDALTRKNNQGDWIVFQEWEQDKRPKHRRSVKRKAFYYDSLFEKSLMNTEMSLFSSENNDLSKLIKYMPVDLMKVWEERIVPVQCKLNL